MVGSDVLAADEELLGDFWSGMLFNNQFLYFFFPFCQDQRVSSTSAQVFHLPFNNFLAPVGLPGWQLMDGF